MPAKLIDVMTKERKRFGKVYEAEKTDYQVEVIPGKSISIFYKGVLSNSFAIGDYAEYDSFNLSYYGTIVKITDKCVWVQKKYDSSKKMLDFNTFCWRNKNFDVDQAAKENADTMQYI